MYVDGALCLSGTLGPLSGHISNNVGPVKSFFRFF
jgi:hypothetical protein